MHNELVDLALELQSEVLALSFLSSMLPTLCANDPTDEEGEVKRLLIEIKRTVNKIQEILG